MEYTSKEIKKIIEYKSTIMNKFRDILDIYNIKEFGRIHFEISNNVDRNLYIKEINEFIENNILNQNIYTKHVSFHISDDNIYIDGSS